MAATITIRYYINENTTNRQAYGLRMVAVNAVDMPAEIFVMQRRVPSAMDVQESASGDMFMSIAGPVELEEYPTVPPGPDTENPFYRVSEVTLLFNSYTELADAKALIDTAVRALVLALQTAESLDEMEEVTYD